MQPARPPHGRSGWRALAFVWFCLAVAAGAGAGLLAWLGPIAKPEAAIIPAQPSGPSVASIAEDPSAGAAAAKGVAPPDQALLERSAAFPTALLPRIAADGRAARIVYAAPTVVAPAGLPRIAILVSGVGRAERDTQAVIDTLPGPVSLAISAYATLPQATLTAMRAAGHELYASIPMEPQGYPLNDEGSRSLLTGADAGANRTNLEWALSRLEGAVGATGASDGMRGERFADIAGTMDPVLDEVARRGLLYVDPRPGSVAARPGLYVRAVDVVLDDSSARAEIEAKLASLERIAREKGSAIGLASRIQPAIVERLAAWTHTLPNRGFVLVPVSALVPQPASGTTR